MKLSMLFPGQGSQFVGMGKELCEQFDIAEKTFQEANDALGFNLQKLCFEGSLEELTKTQNSQPAVLTASVAAFRVYMQELGNQPYIMAGHSLGEYSALVCTGAMKFTDAVKIVRQRGLFMQDAVPFGVGSMAAVSGLEVSVIEEECIKYNEAGSKVVAVSNYNSPEQIVISGDKEAVEGLSEKFSQKGARVIPLKVSAPFHCPLMQPAADRLNIELQNYTYNDLKYPVIANINAKLYKSKDNIVDYLTKQVVEPVRWIDSMLELKNQEVDFAIEIGPKNVLQNLMKKNIKEIPVYTFKNKDGLEKIRNLVADTQKQKSKDSNLMAVITRCLAVAVCTKNSNWDNDEYQKGVVEPYRKIKQLQMSLEEKGNEPTIQQAEQALDMLKSVFTTKKTPEEEAIGRFSQIFNETKTKELFPNY